MAIRGTTTLLTKPVLLLRVTVLVVILPHMEVTTSTHLGWTTRARRSLTLIPVLRKDEPVGALSRVEGTREEHTDKRHRARPTILEAATASTD